MQQHIKIAVIGGTGKSGKYLVKELISKGYSIRLLHRKPETLTLNSSLVEIFKGDARDASAISGLITGTQAVISTLSQPAGEPSIFSDATRNIISAMEQHHVSRYIVIAGLNVDTPFDQKGDVTQAGTDWMRANYPITTQDRQVEYELLKSSSINWTMVRLPLIAQTGERKGILSSLTDCPGTGISATDLADFLISQLTDDTFSRRAPFIANG